MNNVRKKVNNNIHIDFSLKKKDTVERISLGLRSSTIKLLEAKAKSNDVSFSYAADQILKQYLTQEE